MNRTALSPLSPRYERNISSFLNISFVEEQTDEVETTQGPKCQPENDPPCVTSPTAALKIKHKTLREGWRGRGRRERQHDGERTRRLRVKICLRSAAAGDKQKVFIWCLLIPSAEAQHGSCFRSITDNQLLVPTGWIQIFLFLKEVPNRIVYARLKWRTWAENNF